jgi:uncharacterized protein (DUF2062 family)
LKYNRQLKYYFLKFIRLRGEPQELALGLALGIFTGMMPIMPFQSALAVALALIFKGSKITALIGTWVSNPLNWYFLYYYSYRIGASLMGLSTKDGIFPSVMTSFQNGENVFIVFGKILGAGSTIIFAFLFGGFLMGVVVSMPSYFLFLRIFQFIRKWREERRNRRSWRRENL